MSHVGNKLSRKLWCFVQDLNTYRIIFIKHMSHVGTKLSRKLWCFVQDLNIYRIIFLNICHTLVPEALQVALWPLPRFSGSEKNNQIRWNIIKWKQQSKLVKQYQFTKKNATRLVVELVQLRCCILKWKALPLIIKSIFTRVVHKLRNRRWGGERSLQMFPVLH